MKTHDQMERMLEQFRPAGPPAAMRHRVLAAAAASRRAGAWRPSPFWVAIAAMLFLAVGLHWATQNLSARTVQAVGIGPAVWTLDAQQAAALLGDDRFARQYVALGLMATGA